VKKTIVRSEGRVEKKTSNGFDKKAASELKVTAKRHQTQMNRGEEGEIR
jgi:hypothetical protein